MLILNAEQVRMALPMPAAIEAMKQAFAMLSQGRAVVPPRAHLEIERNHGISLVMSAYLDAESPTDQALAVKLVSLFDGNRAAGLARIQALVIAAEPNTGKPIAVLDGAALTAIRTAAASGAATDLLANPGAGVLAILGAGAQARPHIEAICAVRPVREIRIYAPTRERVEQVIRDVVRFSSARIIAAASASDAVRGADLVCTVTTSRSPVLDDTDVLAGAHLNAVGSFRPEVVELPPNLVCRSRVFVDSRSAAWDEAGDLIQPLRAGRITTHHVLGELGELVVGSCPGRISPHDVTLFKSVGVAVQDAAAAREAVRTALESGIGTQIEW